LTEERDETKPHEESAESKPITDADLAEIDIDITKLVEEFEMEFAGKA
jgi:hypothetical protein